MRNQNKQAENGDLLYIESIMTKSEIRLKEFSFLILAVYSFLSGVVC